jgi:hypothetical protein
MSSTVDGFLVVFLALNVAMMLFARVLGRGWSRFTTLVQSRAAAQRLYRKWWSHQQLDGWRDPAAAAKVFFWSGLLNCTGILLFRAFLIPHL